MSGGKNIRQHFEKDTPHQGIFDKAKRDCGKFLILAESQKMRFSKTKFAKI